MIITIFVFALILGVLIFIHEFGHFAMAKKIGVKVEEFGFGLPPRIWGKKVGDTIYSINWLPIGGFVKLLGEDEENDQTSGIKHQTSDKKRYFWARSKKERAVILLAGVTMNFLLAVIVISFIYTQGVATPTKRVHVEKIIANTPAEKAGIKEQDIIISFASQSITSTEELIKVTQENSNKETPMIIERSGNQLTVSITPRQNPPKEEGPMGVVISNMEIKKYPVWQAPFYGTIETIKLSYLMITTLALLVWKLISFQNVGMDVAGPIGIAQATGQAVKYGFMAVLQLMGLLSLNLAIVNILPIPALDGGRLLFVFLEKILGKKVKPQAERVAHQIGMVFLLGLIILVTINDIVRLIRG